MIRLALVVLLAQNALSASVLQVQTQPWSPLPPFVDNGQMVSSSMLENCFTIKDSGETNLYILLFQEVMYDFADLPTYVENVWALSKAISLLAEVSSIRAGDVCNYASLINAVTSNQGINEALAVYVDTIIAGINNIIALSSNNPNIFYNEPVLGQCTAEERQYDLAQVWTNAIANSPSDATLLNEEFCAARRLANAYNSRSNNVAAAVTSAMTRPAFELWSKCDTYASAFLKAIAANQDATATANALKNALINALSTTIY